MPTQAFPPRLQAADEFKIDLGSLAVDGTPQPVLDSVVDLPQSNLLVRNGQEAATAHDMYSAECGTTIPCHPQSRRQ